MENVELQLYSVRDYSVQNFIETIEKVAALGYKGVEFAGYGELAARDMKQLLNRTGMEASASHIGFDSLKNNLDREIEYAKEVGIEYIVCPYLDIKTREDTLIAAEEMTVITEKCKKNNIGIAYHNHAHELRKDNHEFLLDILFDNTPGLDCELDVFWVAYAGIDVISYMKKFKGRLPLIHLKEMDASHNNVDFGKGILDFSAIIHTAKELGTKHFFVEQEEYETDSMTSVKTDIEYLKRLVV